MQVEAAQSARRTTLAALAAALTAVAVAAWLGWRMHADFRRELGAEPADARDALRRIADGDLSAAAQTGVPERSLMGELQRTREGLRRLVAQVHDSTEGVRTASHEIASGNADLGQRTENAASRLDQTTSAVHELTDSVRGNAEAARSANALAGEASGVAQRGGEVVARVVSTMDEIHASSQRIADIIGVIDGIAFQTNILGAQRRGGKRRAPASRGAASRSSPAKCAVWRSAALRPRARSRA